MSSFQPSSHVSPSGSRVQSRQASSARVPLLCNSGTPSEASSSSRFAMSSRGAVQRLQSGCLPGSTHSISSSQSERSTATPGIIGASGYTSSPLITPRSAKATGGISSLPYMQRAARLSNGNSIAPSSSSMSSGAYPVNIPISNGGSLSGSVRSNQSSNSPQWGGAVSMNRQPQRLSSAPTSLLSNSRYVSLGNGTTNTPRGTVVCSRETSSRTSPPTSDVLCANTAALKAAMGQQQSARGIDEPVVFRSAAQSVKSAKSGASREAGREVVVGGRRGAVIWDGRPEHKFVRVSWLDDGSESGVIPESHIAQEVIMFDTSGCDQASAGPRELAAAAAAAKMAQNRELVQKMSADQAAAECAAARHKGVDMVWTPEKGKQILGTATEPPEIGAVIRVTTDAALYELECRASGLSWPNAADGQPRSSKMGCMGTVEKIDHHDSTACLSDGIQWVPIGALCGYECFRSYLKAASTASSPDKEQFYESQKVAQESLWEAFDSVGKAKNMLLSAGQQLTKPGSSAADQAALFQARALAELAAAEGAVSAAEKAVSVSPRQAAELSCIDGLKRLL